MSALVNKHFMIDDDASYRTGSVIALVSEGIYLIACDNMQDNDVRLPLELACIDEMLFVQGGVRRFNFFETRADLDAWLKWLDTPSEARPKVVSLVRR